MKIKLWQWEFEFDKDDAKIVVPFALMLLAFFFTPLRKEWLLLGASCYYVLFFFLKPSLLLLRQGSAVAYRAVSHFWRNRCPYCKSRELILQGYQGFHSDEAYAYYFCNHCHQTAVLVNERFLKANALTSEN